MVSVKGFRAGSARHVVSAALCLERKKESSENRAPGTGGCKGLILLRPFSEVFRRFPRKATCGWFWVPFAIKRYKNPQPERLPLWRFLSRQKAPQKPPGTMKKPERRGLTLAPGDYSRVCKQTVPGARIFSPHLPFRFFHQAGNSPRTNLLTGLRNRFYGRWYL